MTQDEIIEMAKQVGVDMSLGEHWSFFIEELEAFAKLVAEKEREACAQICDSVNNYSNPMTANDVADAIRARGEA